MVVAWPRPIGAIFCIFIGKGGGEVSVMSVPLIHPTLKINLTPYRFVANSSQMTLTGLIRG